MLNSNSDQINDIDMPNFIINELIEDAKARFHKCVDLDMALSWVNGDIRSELAPCLLLKFRNSNKRLREEFGIFCKLLYDLDNSFQLEIRKDDFMAIINKENIENASLSIHTITSEWYALEWQKMRHQDHIAKTISSSNMSQHLIKSQSLSDNQFFFLDKSTQ